MGFLSKLFGIKSDKDITPEMRKKAMEALRKRGAKVKGLKKVKAVSARQKALNALMQD